MIENRYFLYQSEQYGYPLVLEAAFSLAKGDSQIKEIVLLSDTVRSAAALAYTFRQEAAYSPADSGVSTPILRHEALFNVAHTSKESKRILIAVNLDERQLVAVDELEDVSHLIAVSERREPIEAWVRRWAADEISPGLILRQGVELDRPSAIVCQAIDELSAANQSHRMLDLSERARAKTYARALFKFEPELDPDRIEAYLLRSKSWRATNAKSFSDLLRRLIAGRSFKGGELSGLANHYKRWLDRAAAKSGGRPE